jgi:hypothetical protein
VPQLGSVAVPSWAVVERDGELALPLRPAGEEATVFADLEKLARWQEALALVPPAGLLASDLELSLFRRGPAGDEWILLDDGVRLSPGDQLGIEVRHRYDTPLYVTLLVFDSDCAITQLHPRGVVEELLDPGRTLAIGKRPGDVIKLTPPARPLPAGRSFDYVKLFASTAPIDFASLLQDGVRDEIDDGKTLLRQLLDRALHGAKSGRPRPLERTVGEEWGVAVRQIRTA